MGIEADLAAEIKKWSKKLDDSLSNVRHSNERGARMLQNINAYRSDSKHFLEEGDLIKSFECLIWAWANLELGKELELFRTSYQKDAK